MDIKSVSLVATASLFALSANAAVINFDNQPEDYSGGPFVEGEYVFTDNYNGLGTNNNSLWPSNGTTHLMSWTNGGSSSGFNLTNSLNSTFDVQSFDFVGGYASGSQPVTSLIVTGLLGGSEVNSLTFNASTDFLNHTSYTTLGISFSGIDTLQVEAIGASNRAQFDNFIIDTATTAVPVPAAAWLFGSGLLGLVGVARRKKA